MANDDHYAILLTINRYPGIGDLDGPDNDGGDFAEWLQDPRYGNLPADPDHICRIRSSNFDAGIDPYDADPTELELKRALNRWLRTSEDWHDRIGERLYLFFAGHGFTAGSHINDPALFSAVAQSGDAAHIAVFRYASKIANAGFFDEIVLVTDCCQDVLKASQVLEPTWSPPDRQRTGHVRLFQAYGAPRGRKSFERDIGPAGESRGLFSSVLMEALRNAPAEDDGWVTDRTVKDLFLALWEQRYQQETGYTPPLRSPDSGRIRFYRRDAAAPGGPQASSVPPRITVDLRHVIARASDIERQAGDPGNASPAVSSPGDTRGGRLKLRSDALLRLESPVVDLEPGLHVIVTPGGQPDLVFEVPRAATGPTGALPVPAPVAVSAAQDGVSPEQQVLLTTSGSGAEITVLDAGYTTVATGIGTLSLSLSPGAYKAQARIGAMLTHSLFSVADTPLVLPLATPEFPSAAPVAGTSTTHEYQSHPAVAFTQIPLDTTEDEGEIAIYARDSLHPPDTSAGMRPPWRRLRIVRLSGAANSPRAPLQESDDRHGYAFFRTAAAPGTFGLLIQRDDGMLDDHGEQGLVVPVIAGWRTEVHLDCIDSTEASGNGARVLDPVSASYHLVRVGEPSLLLEPLGLSTEVARAQLAAGHAVALPDGEAASASPMWALYAAHAAWQQEPQDRDAVGHCLQAVPTEVREGLSDFALLARWLDTPHDAKPRDDLPILASSWHLAAQLEPEAGLAPGLTEAIGQWRTGGSLLTTWQRPAPDNDALALHLQPEPGQSDAPVFKHNPPSMAQPTLEPSYSLEVWAQVVPGLRRPAPGQSPFQQALRRRILDAVAEGHLPEPDVFALAAEFMLSPDYAAKDYRDLYRHASGGVFEVADINVNTAAWQSLES